MIAAINGPNLWGDRFPWPAEDVHKHSRGALAVVSGPASRTGAARLAARAGLRIGAGVVTVLSPPGAVMVHAMALEAVMVRAFADAQALGSAAAGMRAAVIGPAAGVGQATVDNVAALRGSVGSLVLDADALTSFQGDMEALAALTRPGDVLTPHDGEFARLWPGLLQGGRERAASEAARQSGAVLILKGPETLIAGPDGQLVSNPNGVPWLATAGSGDVLAGLVGGLLAQGTEAFDAACMAVWLHAAAAGQFGPGLIAEDLPDLIPPLLVRIFEKGRAS